MRQQEKIFCFRWENRQEHKTHTLPQKLRYSFMLVGLRYLLTLPRKSQQVDVLTSPICMYLCACVCVCACLYENWFDF